MQRGVPLSKLAEFDSSSGSRLQVAAPVVARKFGHVYIRVSSGEQAETGNSIENQRSQCRDYAARHNIVVRDVYVDAGISGRRINRPELMRMQAAVENGEHIIAYSVSRLSRSVRDFIGIVEWAEDHNLTLHTVKEAIDTKSAYGSFLTMLFSALSQLEANLTQERMAELNTRKMRRGETTKAPPFGYRSVKYRVGLPARLIPDLTEQGAITRMFDLRWQNQFQLMAMRKIAEKLTQEGHKPRRSSAFTVESIRQIMAREYEFRMRVHGTLTIPEFVIQRYIDLCMPFIVPMAVKEDYVVVGENGLPTYNGQFEDTSIVADKVHFFTSRRAGATAQKKRSGPKTATMLDLHLMLYDREREEERMHSQLIDQETINRRGIFEVEAREFRRLLEKIVASQMKLNVVLSGMRETFADDLKMAQIRYKIHVEENRGMNPLYDERDDSKALEMRLTVITLTRKLAECTVPQGQAITALQKFSGGIAVGLPAAKIMQRVTRM